MKKKNLQHGIPKQYRSKEFQSLQDKWYKKLKRDGFNELEWSEPGGQNSSYLKSPLSRVAKTYNESTVEHYRRCRIHMSHHRWGRRNLLDKFIFECYTKGESYRTIIKSIVKRRGFRKKAYSVYFIHSRIHKLLDVMNEKKLWERGDLG